LSYLPVSLLILHPVIPRFFSALPYASNGDTRLSIAILFSNLKNLSRLDFQQIYHLPILFPLSHTMTAGVNLFGQSVLALPLYILHIRNAYVLYNILVIMAYVLAGAGCYLFVREWGVDRFPAWLSGAIYVLLPFRVHNIPQLNLLFSFPIPFALLFFTRFLKNGRPRHLVWFTGALFTQFLFDLTLGMFLVMAVTIYFLAHLALIGNLRLHSWMQAGGAILLFVLVFLLVFQPYLTKEASFSRIDEIHALPDASFHSSISFYTNWSYLLLFGNRVLWGHPPYSPGVSVMIFFLFLFLPYLAGRTQRVSGGLMALFLLTPALALPLITGNPITAFAYSFSKWSLAFFLIAMAVTLILLRRSLPRKIQLLSWSFAILIFLSNQVSLPHLNPLRHLSKSISFFSRMRGIRTQYIILLLFLALFAIGFQRFLQVFRKKKILLMLIVLLIFAERIRWPVTVEAFTDDTLPHRELYATLAPYPDHYGLMELPFLSSYSNTYPLFTQYHDKHTYHGMVHYLSDPCEFAAFPELSIEKGYPGLMDPQTIHSLKDKGIRLILLFKNRVDADPIAGESRWGQILIHTREGERRGLFERVQKTRAGLLLVLAERETGPVIRYFLPYYTLAGKRKLICDLHSRQSETVDFLFNGVNLLTRILPGSGSDRIEIPLEGVTLHPQANHLEIRTNGNVELVRVRIDS